MGVLEGTSICDYAYFTIESRIRINFRNETSTMRKHNKHTDFHGIY